MPTILITGLPRSGTTLLCALLNECAATVALAEPLVLHEHQDLDRAVEDIERFVEETRRGLLATGSAMSKHVDGRVPDNWVEDPKVLRQGRLRRVLEQRGEIAAGKSLEEEFYLVIKHPAEFTALAEPLGRRFPLYALVRHPLAVLASWQTVEMPVHYGHMPMMERFVPGLTERLDAIDDRLARQVELMRFLYGTYACFAPDRVLRYEDLVVRPKETLLQLSPHAVEPASPLFACDPRTRYGNIDLAVLAEALRPLAPVAELFYPDFTASTVRNYC